MKLSDLIPSRAKILLLAAQTIVASAIATGFFYSGYLSTAVSLLAKTGIIISAEIFATQVALSAAIGLLSVVAANAVWYAGKGVYNWFAGTESKPTRVKTAQTDKARYSQELKTVNTHNKELENESVNCKTIINTFNNLIKKAGKPKFDENGMLAKDQPVRNVLQIARWKEKRLEQINNISNDKHECAALKREITEKARHKMEKRSNKPLFS